MVIVIFAGYNVFVNFYNKLLPHVTALFLTLEQLKNIRLGHKQYNKNYVKCNEEQHQAKPLK